MLKRTVMAVAIALALGACDDKLAGKDDAKPAPIKVHLLVNVIKGVTRAPDDNNPDHTNQPTSAELKKKISDAVKGAGDILKGAELDPVFDPDNDIQEVENPDGSKTPEMNGKYDSDDLKKVDDAAAAELKKKFGKPDQGFKIYVALTIKNRPPGEDGVSYSSIDPPSPGFSIIEAGELEARLLAHEIGHGLGCLDDTEKKGALMNPKGTKDDKELSDEEKKKLKKCAEMRATK